MTAVVVGVASVAIYFVLPTNLMGDELTFGLLTAALLVYLGIEVNKVRREHPERWLIDPAVLCSFFTFAGGYGISNLIFHLPPEMSGLVTIASDVTPAMNKVMMLALIGAATMWFAYWSPLPERLSSGGVIGLFRMRFFESSVRLKGWALLVLVGVSLASRITQVRLGLFGYSAEYDRLIELGSITQYLAIGAGLGKLALVAAAIEYYGHRGVRRTQVWFLLILALETGAGFLSGFKSAAVMPLLIVGFCQYLRTARVSYRWLVAAPLLLMAAYAVIEPFRGARIDDYAHKGTSVTAILDTLVGSSAPVGFGAVDNAPFAVRIMARLNLTYASSVGIEYSDDFGGLPDGGPDFLGDLLLAPAHAVVPRLLWEEKSLGNIGLWYTQAVMGFSFVSSTAMGPITYLYFAGGVFAVGIGFLLIGFVQRLLVLSTNPTRSAAGGLVFMGMLSTVVTVDSAFNSIIITLFRELPLLLILQALLYKRVGTIEPRPTYAATLTDPGIGRIHTARRNSAGH